MASLYILNKLSKSLKIFVPATSNLDIIVAGTFKIVIEHTLLKYEMLAYNVLFAIPVVSDLHTINSNLMYPFVFGLLTTLPIIYGAPLYRTYKSITNNKLEIINFEKKRLN